MAQQSRKRSSQLRTRARLLSKAAKTADSAGLNFQRNLFRKEVARLNRETRKALKAGN